jgi:hypothetical protein
MNDPASPNPDGGHCASVYDAFEHTRSQYRDRPFLHVPPQCAGGAVDVTYKEVFAYIVTATQKRRYGVVAELAKSLVAAGGPGLFDVRHSKRRAVH